MDREIQLINSLPPDINLKVPLIRSYLAGLKRICLLSDQRFLRSFPEGLLQWRLFGVGRGVTHFFYLTQTTQESIDFEINRAELDPSIRELLSQMLKINPKERGTAGEVYATLKSSSGRGD